MNQFDNDIWDVIDSPVWMALFYGILCLGPVFWCFIVYLI
jgi:hypothetical protein